MELKGGLRSKLTSPNTRAATHEARTQTPHALSYSQALKHSLNIQKLVTKKTMADGFTPWTKS